MPRVSKKESWWAKEVPVLPTEAGETKYFLCHSVYFLELHVFQLKTKQQNKSCMLHLSFSPSWFPMQFVFLSRKTALKIILSIYLILFKIVFYMFVTSIYLHTIGSGLPITSLGLDYQQGHTRPFLPWWSTKQGRSNSSILPLLLVYLPACDPVSRMDHVPTCRFPTGLSARPYLDFLGPSAVLSWDITHHYPTHSFPVRCSSPLSATQLTSQDPRTCFLIQRSHL